MKNLQEGRSAKANRLVKELSNDIRGKLTENSDVELEADG
jgi:hypothetical protein